MGLGAPPECSCGQLRRLTISMGGVWTGEGLKMSSRERTLKSGVRKRGQLSAAHVWGCLGRMD